MLRYKQMLKEHKQKEIPVATDIIFALIALLLGE